jgi:hypothetical protein
MACDLAILSRPASVAHCADGSPPIVDARMTGRPSLIPPPPEPLDPAIIALVDALARDMAREDHRRERAMPPRQDLISVVQL